MRRFELARETGAHFFEVSVEDVFLATRFGTPSAEETHLDTLASPEAALAARDERVREKLAQGYVEARRPVLSGLVWRLEHWLKAHRPRFHEALNPGASLVRVVRLERLVGFDLPRTFRDLYLWRNGQSLRTKECFQDQWRFMSLEEIASAWKRLKAQVDSGEIDESKNWWRRRWVPFLEKGEGIHLCVDMGGAFDGAKGQLIELFPEEDWRDVPYPSIDVWLQVFVTTLEAGAWKLDDDGFAFERDFGLLEKTLKKLCPGYPLKRRLPPPVAPDGA